MHPTRRSTSRLLIAVLFAASSSGLLAETNVTQASPDPLHHFELARAAARDGKRDQALAELNQAASLGFSDIERLHTEADLQSVRSDEGFTNVSYLVSLNALNKLEAGPSAPAPEASQTPVAPAPVAVEPTPVPARDPGPASPPVPAGPAVEPAPHSSQNGVPVGLYARSPFSSTLPDLLYYFAPDGQVYTNLSTGFSATELAAPGVMRGTARRSGNDLEVTWADGKVVKDRIVGKTKAIVWNEGIWLKASVLPRSQALVALWQRNTGGLGAQLSSGKSLEFKADGTYTGLQATRASNVFRDGTGVGSSTSAAGRWTLSGYTLSLSDSEGNSDRMIVAGIDTAGDPAAPSWVWIGTGGYRR